MTDSIDNAEACVDLERRIRLELAEQGYPDIAVKVDGSAPGRPLVAIGAPDEEIPHGVAWLAAERAGVGPRPVCRACSLAANPGPGPRPMAEGHAVARLARDRCQATARCADDCGIPR